MERWHGEVEGTQVFEPDALALKEFITVTVDKSPKVFLILLQNRINKSYYIRLLTGLNTLFSASPGVCSRVGI